jgi:hypothetical protein
LLDRQRVIAPMPISMMMIAITQAKIGRSMKIATWLAARRARRPPLSRRRAAAP